MADGIRSGSRSSARSASYRHGARGGQSRRFADRRRNRAVIGASAGAVAVATWLYVASSLSFLPGMTIYSVSVYGTDRHAAASIEAASYAALRGAYGGLLARANAFLYPKSEIAAAASAASPQVHSVSVARVGMHEIAVSVSEKPGDAIVCADLPDAAGLSAPAASSTDEHCYVADETGYVFKRMQGGPSSLDRFYAPFMPAADPIGSYATSTAAWKAFASFVKSAKTAGISVRAALIGAGGQYEIYADAPGADSIIVIHATEAAGLDVERDNLVSFWQRMASEARAAGKPMDLVDIKLQYPPNVYYTQGTR